MASNSLVDIASLSPKFQELYAKAKDFVEVKNILA
jgi:acyl-CoA dehydrogenase